MSESQPRIFVTSTCCSGHRSPVSQQADRVSGGQELYPQVSVLPQGGADGRAAHVAGGLPKPPRFQATAEEGAAAVAAAATGTAPQPTFNLVFKRFLKCCATATFLGGSGSPGADSGPIRIFSLQQRNII